MDVPQHLGVFAGARMPTPEIPSGHRNSGRQPGPLLRRRHIHCYTLKTYLKEWPQPTKRVYPKEPYLEQDYLDRESALHLNKIRGRIYTPAGLPADSAFGPAVTLSDTPNNRARLVGEITQVENLNFLAEVKKQEGSEGDSSGV